MNTTTLFALGKTNQISPHFNAPVVITGFNLLPYSHETDENGIITREYCGDYVYFEELLFDGVYDVSCKGKPIEKGILLSEPVRDECGNLITLDACKNSVELTKPGIYRAIYHGEGRPEAAVIYVSL